MWRCHVPTCSGHNDVLMAIHHAQEAIMSTLTDLTTTAQQLADAVAANTAAIGRIDSDFAALKAALPPAGTLTADQQAQLDAAVSSLGGSISALTASTAAVDAADPEPAGSDQPAS
jgi:hypothetical protein